MNINLQVIYSIKDGGTLCFRHAVHAALAGNDIQTEVDDFGGEYDMRVTACHLCLSDTFNEVFKKEDNYFTDCEDEEGCLDCNYVECICEDNESYEDKPKLTQKEIDITTKGFSIKRKR